MHASCEVSGLMAESHRLLEHLFETRVPCLEVVVLQLHSQSSFQSQDHMCEIEKDIVSSNDDTHRVVSQGGSRYGHSEKRVYRSGLGHQDCVPLPPSLFEDT